MKVIISAYACSPYKGSEPGVGWGFVKGLAPLHDLCVITELSFKEDIDNYINKYPELLKVRFEYVARARSRVAERIWPPAYYWTYRRWHQDAYRLAQQLHQEMVFDVAHQLTMVGFREPGYLWKLGIPFVWGPVGGMGFFPWRFLPVVGGYGALYYLGYNFFNWWHMNFLARPRQAANAAASGAANGLITATTENRAGAVKCWRCASSVLNEVGLPFEPFPNIHERAAEEPLRIFWSGLHIPRKALNLALQALSRLPADIDWEITILGEGRKTNEWQLLAAELGIGPRCHFLGWVPREQALDVMARAHLVLITSLRDLTSTVTVEALALGLPIICLDHCGFADVVNEQCGIKIFVTNPGEVVVEMTRVIEKLARDESERQTLARGALQRARDFSWKDKACVIDQIYRAKVAGTRIAVVGDL